MRKLSLLISLALVGFYGLWPAWTGYRVRQAFEADDPALLERVVDFPAVRASLKPAITAEAEGAFERIKRDAGPLGGLIAGTIKGELMGRLVDGAINSAVTPPNVVRMVREGKSIRQSLERVIVEQAGGTAGLRLPGLGGRREKAGTVDPANNDPGQRDDKGREGDQRPLSAGEARAGTTATATGSPGGSGQVSGQSGAAAASEGASGAVGSVGTAGSARPSEAPRRRRMGLANIKSFSILDPLAFSVGVAKDADAKEPELTATLRFTGTDWRVVAVTPDFAARRANNGQ